MLRRAQHEIVTATLYGRVSTEEYAGIDVVHEPNCERPRSTRRKNNDDVASRVRTCIYMRTTYGETVEWSAASSPVSTSGRAQSEKPVNSSRGGVLLPSPLRSGRMARLQYCTRSELDSPSARARACESGCCNYVGVQSPCFLDSAWQIAFRPHGVSRTSVTSKTPCLSRSRLESIERRNNSRRKQCPTIVARVFLTNGNPKHLADGCFDRNLLNEN